MSYAVIGAGIVGASVAYHLSLETNDPVTVFERHSPGSETTTKSVAQFGYYGDETQYRMKRYGMRLYNEFFRETTAHPRYVFAGLLEVATTEEGAAELEHAVAVDGDESLGKVAGTGFDWDLVEYIPGDEIHEKMLLPPVDTSVIEGALYRPKMGYFNRPHELVHEFKNRAEANGATFRSNTRVEEIRTKGGRVTGLVTDGGEEFEFDDVVCAAGPWNVKLAESVGLDIPVEHTLAPILELEPPEPLEYSFPALGHWESPYSVHHRHPTEFLAGYNPGPDQRTRYDPDTMSDSVPTDIRDGMSDTLELLVPSMLDADIVDEWVGVRSQTPDGNPIVGWTDLEGFSIAAFHTSGIQLAPMAGKVIASQLVHDDPTDLYDGLSITRFDGYTDHRS